jgi:hypothetical protein
MSDPIILKQSFAEAGGINSFPNLKPVGFCKT